MTREEVIARDLNRNVWTVMGLPFDCTTEQETTDHLINSIQNEERCFFTTPNLNFAITAQNDSQFRDSVINSDWVVADGMPLIWIAKSLGIPLPERVAGSSVFERLRQDYKNHNRPIRVVFFGGPDGTAAEAFKKIATDDSNMEVVGFYSPGFGSMEEMSNPDVINQINKSDADLLIVALGAKRGQQWIELNRHQLDVPVISHLGAVINFVAGTVNRAPVWIQRSGLEWVWRIKEESSLLQRYLSDGIAFVKLYFCVVTPYKKLVYKISPPTEPKENHTVQIKLNRAIVHLHGVYTAENIEAFRTTLTSLIIESKSIELDCTNVRYVDPRFLGLLLVAKKNLTHLGHYLEIVNCPANLKKILAGNLLTETLSSTKIVSI